MGGRSLAPSTLDFLADDGSSDFNDNLDIDEGTDNRAYHLAGSLVANRRPKRPTGGPSQNDANQP